MAGNIPDRILSENEEDKLVSWIGKQCQFELLYKLSQNGLSARTFHQLCDDKGPTVTVLYNTIGNVFGGYLSQSWNSSNVLIKDDNAFVFKLRDRDQKCMEKFNIETPAMAACGIGHWGPTFGGRAATGIIPNLQNQVPSSQNPELSDLHTFSDGHHLYNPHQMHKYIQQQGIVLKTQKNSGHSFTLNGEENLGCCYNINAFNHNFRAKLKMQTLMNPFIGVEYGQQSKPLSGGDFCIRDLEVYLVKGEYCF